MAAGRPDDADRAGAFSRPGAPLPGWDAGNSRVSYARRHLDRDRFVRASFATGSGVARGVDPSPHGRARDRQCGGEFADYRAWPRHCAKLQGLHRRPLGPARRGYRQHFGAARAEQGGNRLECQLRQQVGGLAGLRQPGRAVIADAGPEPGTHPQHQYRYRHPCVSRYAGTGRGDGVRNDNTRCHGGLAGGPAGSAGPGRGQDRIVVSDRQAPG